MEKKRFKFEGNNLPMFDEWKNRFGRGQQWREGASACSLARFICKDTKMNGLERLSSILNACGFSEFDTSSCQCEVEASVEFDNLGKSSQRDMVLTGALGNGEKVFVTIEAKVNEPFEESISAVIKKQMNNPGNIKRGNCRAKQLLSDFGVEDEDLRYQLFHATAATLRHQNIEYEDINFAHHIMIVLVFKTERRNNSTQNYKDFIKFVEAINGHKDVNKLTREMPVGKDTVKFLGEYTPEVSGRTDEESKKKVTFIYAEIDLPKQDEH